MVSGTKLTVLDHLASGLHVICADGDHPGLLAAHGDAEPEALSARRPKSASDLLSRYA